MKIAEKVSLSQERYGAYEEVYGKFTDKYTRIVSLYEAAKNKCKS